METVKVDGGEDVRDVEDHRIKACEQLHLPPGDRGRHAELASRGAEDSCRTCVERMPERFRRACSSSSSAMACFAGESWSSLYTSTLVSKKLRALMEFVALEAPAT